MLFILYKSQLCSERLISNVEHLIINPPLQSVFNLAFCYQLSLSMIALMHTLQTLAGKRVWKRKQGRALTNLGILGLMSFYFTV